MRAPQARPARMVLSTAARLMKGSVPGWPRQTGQVRELGGAPKRFRHRQNILVRVESWTCTSSPITGSHFGCREALTLISSATAVLPPARDRRLGPVMGGGLLVSVGEPQHSRVLERPSQDLGADRQLAAGESTGKGDPRNRGQ